MTRWTAPARLRDRLLLRLTLPLLAIVAVAGSLGALSAQRLTQQVYDHWLMDAALSLAQQVRFVGDRASIELPPVAAAMLAYDDTDRVAFSITDGGVPLVGPSDLPTDGRHRTCYERGCAFDAMLNGRAVRIAAVEVRGPSPSSAVVARVAETTLKREQMQHAVVALLWPMALLVVAAAVAIAVAVRLTIRPLEAIAANWNAQSYESLQAIGVDGIPRELMPFANALNGLLMRMRRMLARERQFAATAAHQLRTPLTRLQLGLARAAGAGHLDDARPLLRELERTTQRTARLVQQLLLVSRLDPEVGSALVRVPTDLVELVRETGMSFADAALEQHIDLELRAPDAAVVVPIQPELLTEAIGNLLDNAMRYTPAGGHIRVEVSDAPPTVRVVDSGPGIPVEQRERIFDRHVRGDRPVGAGSGLGLAIVRDVAALHAASVSVGRSELGGASIEIVLPRDAEALPAQRGKAVAPSLAEPTAAR